MEDLKYAGISNIFLMLLIIISVTTIAESKAINKEEASNSKCPEKDIDRFKRGATDIIGSVQGLVTGILDSTWGHIARMKGIPKEETTVYGGGNYNENTFTLDYEYEYQ